MAMIALSMSYLRRLLTQAARDRSSPASMAGAIAALLLFTTAARWFFNPYLGGQLPYFFYLPAIIFATALFGFRAGLIITGASLAAAVYFWLPPNWIPDLACWLLISILLVATIALLQQSARIEQRAAEELRYRSQQLEEQTARLQASEAKLAMHSKQLEQAVAERTAKLADTIAELESFSYTVSHDLRSPLRAMQGFAEILLAEQGEKLDAGSLEHLKRIEESALRMDRLVRDVLAYHGVGKNSYDAHEIDLDRVLKVVMAEKPELKGASVEIVYPLQPVVGNAAGLAQAIGQILANAVKFVRPAQAPWIRMWTESHGQKVRFCVQDDGIGIDPNAVNHIFKPFHRGQIEPRFEGTGIGLAVVKRAIERQNGSVGVEPAPGGGSIFWLELPAVPPAASA